MRVYSGTAVSDVSPPASARFRARTPEDYSWCPAWRLALHTPHASPRASLPSRRAGYSSPCLAGTGAVIHGADYRLYEAAAARSLHGDLSSIPRRWPVHTASGTSRGERYLYPPVILWLLVPFTVLPALLWWAIPVLDHRLVGEARSGPAWWAWPVLLVIAVVPDTPTVFLSGNPAMRALAALSLGAVLRSPLLFVLLKPSLFPFACWVWDQRWWLALAAGVVACVPFGAMSARLRSRGRERGGLAQILARRGALDVCATRSVHGDMLSAQRERSPSRAAARRAASGRPRRAAQPLTLDERYMAGRCEQDAKHDEEPRRLREPRPTKLPAIGTRSGLRLLPRLLEPTPGVLTPAARKPRSVSFDPANSPPDPDVLGRVRRRLKWPRASTSRAPGPA